MGSTLERLEYLKNTNYSLGEGAFKKLAINIKILGLNQVLCRLSPKKLKGGKKAEVKAEFAFLYSYLKREKLIQIEKNSFYFRSNLNYMRAYEECFLLCEDADLFYEELHSEHKNNLTAVPYDSTRFKAKTGKRKSSFNGEDEYNTDNEMKMLTNCLKQKMGRIKEFYRDNGYMPYELALKGIKADKSDVMEKMKISYKYEDLYEALYLSASSAKGLFRCYCNKNKEDLGLSSEEIGLWFGTEEQEGKLVFMDSYVQISGNGEFVYHKYLKSAETSMNVCIFLPEDMDNADKIKKLFRDCWESFAFRDENDSGVTMLYQQYEVEREAV